MVTQYVVSFIYCYAICMNIIIARLVIVVCVFFFSSYSQLDLLLARTINLTGSQHPLPVTSIAQQNQPTVFTRMSNTNRQG
jgi:hypothetical protein